MGYTEMEIVSKHLPGMQAVLGNEPKSIKVPPHLYKLPMLATFCAVRGSGKTVAMTSLLRKYQEVGLCQRVFVITETYGSNEHLFTGLVNPEDVFTASDPEALDKVVERLEEESAVWKAYQRDRELYERVKKHKKRYVSGRVPHIDALLLGEAEEKGLIEHPPQYRYGNHVQHPAMFLIIDDAQGSVTMIDAPSRRKTSLTSLCIKHRHVADRLGVSILIAVQSFKSQSGNLSRSLRSNCTICCIWPMKDNKIIEEIAEELGREISKDVFNALYAYATSGAPWNFLAISFAPTTFRKCWDEVLEVKYKKDA